MTICSIARNLVHRTKFSVNQLRLSLMACVEFAYCKWIMTDQRIATSDRGVLFGETRIEQSNICGCVEIKFNWSSDSSDCWRQGKTFWKSTVASCPKTETKLADRGTRASLERHTYVHLHAFSASVSPRSRFRVGSACEPMWQILINDRMSHTLLCRAKNSFKALSNQQIASNEQGTADRPRRHSNLLDWCIDLWRIDRYFGKSSW